MLLSVRQIERQEGSWGLGFCQGKPNGATTPILLNEVIHQSMSEVKRKGGVQRSRGRGVPGTER